jgi:hypothetical protein
MANSTTTPVALAVPKIEPEAPAKADQPKWTNDSWIALTTHRLKVHTTLDEKISTFVCHLSCQAVE